MHGFGFANVLRELGLPTKSQELIASLLAFNVGVEIGQVAIVAVLLPLVIWLGRSAFRDAFIKGVSVIVLLFGLGWLVERVFDCRTCRCEGRSGRHHRFLCLRKGTAGRAGVRVGKGHGFLPRDVQVRDRPG